MGFYRGLYSFYRRYRGYMGLPGAIRTTRKVLDWKVWVRSRGVGIGVVGEFTGSCA